MKGGGTHNAICWHDLALSVYPADTCVCVRRYATEITNKSKMSSVSSLVELRQHYFKFPEVCSLCVLLWKWRRTYNRAVVRPLVSSGWTRRTENLRKKCKLRSDAKHGSRGDLARELYGGFFWCSPEKLPVGVVLYQCFTLQDVDAIKQMAILYLKMAHEYEPIQMFAEGRGASFTRHHSTG